MSLFTPTIPKIAQAATNAFAPTLSPLVTAFSGLFKGAQSTTPATPKVPSLAPGATNTGLVASNGQSVPVPKIAPAPTNINTTSPGLSNVIPSPTPTIKPATASIQVTPSGNKVNANTGALVSPYIPPTPTLPTNDVIPPPSPAAGISYTSPEYEKAVNDYKTNMAMTDDEIKNNEDLTKVLSATRLGSLEQEGQGRGIPLSVVLGKQAQVEKQGLALAEPLQKKAALLQARRTAALEGSKFTLEQLDKRIADNKPISLAQGSSLIDPRTGKVVASMPTKADATENPDRILSATEAQALGVPFGTKARDAYGLSPTKPLTESQGKDLTYANRASESNPILDSMASIVSGYNSAKWLAYTAAENTTMGNSFVPDEIKQIRQAERNFATAILRRESGATISPSEFAVMEKQYFPRPGDDAKTLEQKSQLRRTAIASFQQSAGSTAFPNGSNQGNTGGSVVQTTIGPINPNW